MNLILPCFCWARIHFTGNAKLPYILKQWNSCILQVCAQQKQESMRFMKENTVFGSKKWWKTISISFPKSSETIHINFSTNLYRIFWQGGFTLNRLFFVLFSREITKKKRKYRFWLQKRVKIQRKYYFWELWRLII